MDVKRHMEVVGSDGAHVGTVDHLDGERIKLTRDDSDDKVHHYLGKHLVDQIDAERVYLNIPAAEAKLWHSL